MERPRQAALLCCVALFAFNPIGLTAQNDQVPPELYSSLRWRLIGPFRGGRVTSVCGVPGDHSTYYAGTPGGGVWKTIDGGQVWKPIFDNVDVASVGAVAVAPSDPNRIYVGTGEQTPGDGVWESADAGTTWTNIGLRDTHFISTILVNPTNPDTLLAAALGDRASGENRGVFKTTDGGRLWKKVLYKDDESGVVDMSFDPVAPNIVFATFESGVFGRLQTASEYGIYKSIDGGDTWDRLGGQGLPPSNLGRIGIVAAPDSGGRRVYAIVNQGFFRSDDSGQTWQRTTSDPRIVSTNYFGKVFVNPRNADDVFIGQTSMYRSTDGGHTWNAFNGAPSGDDFHVIWISPDNPKFMIQGVDQGAIVSEDGGNSWSSWYNQPTGQLYHVSTDNQFPYMVYAAQQDSGTVGLPSRSGFGEITDNERFSVDGFEAAFIAPDPSNPNIVYSGGWYGSVVRFDRTTGQLATVFVRGDKYRTASMAPLLFAPKDPRTLYLGTQFLLKSTDGGLSWQQSSPDLTAAPAPSDASQSAVTTGAQLRARAAAIDTISFSAANTGLIWAGTTNGRIQISRDLGKSWHDVTPNDLPAVSSVGTMEASHFDANTAYTSLTAFQNSEPLLYRTRDGGKTWQKIVTGLPTSGTLAGIARFVREDPVRRGLLYAGTETSVWVSFDDGDHWQPLQLNLPPTSMRDLTVHGEDLVLATYGRSIYILDDVTPLRQVSRDIPTAPLLFKPAEAVRIRWDNNQDTPLPREVAAGKNPPDGAIFDYFLPSAATGDASIDITDARGNLVRHFSSAAAAPANSFPNVPEYWFATPAVVSKEAGAHRFVWDLRYAEPRVLPYNYYGALIDYTEYTLADHAIPEETPRVQPQGPLVAPGTYAITLTVNGQAYKQQLTVKIDPRVHTPQSDLEQQLDWALHMTRALSATHDGFFQAHALQEAIAAEQVSASGDQSNEEVTSALKSLAERAASVAQGTHTEPGFGPENRDLARTFTMIESGDMRPADTAKEAAQQICGQVEKSVAAWRELNAQTLPQVNTVLAAHHLAPLPVAANLPGDSPCGK